MTRTSIEASPDRSGPEPRLPEGPPFAAQSKTLRDPSDSTTPSGDGVSTYSLGSSSIPRLEEDAQPDTTLHETPLNTSQDTSVQTHLVDGPSTHSITEEGGPFPRAARPIVAFSKESHNSFTVTTAPRPSLPLKESLGLSGCLGIIGGTLGALATLAFLSFLWFGYGTEPEAKSMHRTLFPILGRCIAYILLMLDRCYQALASPCSSQLDDSDYHIMCSLLAIHYFDPIYGVYIYDSRPYTREILRPEVTRGVSLGCSKYQRWSISATPGNFFVKEKESIHVV